MIHSFARAGALRPCHAIALAAVAACGLLTPSHSEAAPDADIRELRSQIEALRQAYEARLQDLETRLNKAEQAHTAPANALAPAAPIPPTSGTSLAPDNRFNPSIALVLSGTYANFSQTPETWAIPGFAPSGDEVGPGGRGFSLGESELTLSASIDSWLFGSLTLAVTPDDSIETEEAYVQTTALPQGLTLKAGRFLGGIGYLNAQHAHTWDFVDAPLAYQAFFGGQHRQEGLQAKWLLPTDGFVELGAEAGNGASFPGSEAQRNGLGAFALMAHAGGDVGDSHSWRAGVSWLSTRATDREWATEDAGGLAVMNAFTGRSRTWVLDGVWKWAPQGDARRTSFKLQGEYVHRRETGELTHAYDDPLAAQAGAFKSSQSGWYVQGVYQFAPTWRVGLRHDRLHAGRMDWSGNAELLAAPDTTPQRHSMMLDWAPSEFQRWRLQWSDDRVRPGVKDTQIFLQYQVNLGAHGAHAY